MYERENETQRKLIGIIAQDEDEFFSRNVVPDRGEKHEEGNKRDNYSEKTFEEIIFSHVSIIPTR